MSSPLDNAGQIYSTALPQVRDVTGEVNLKAEALTLRKGFTPFHSNPEPFTNPMPSKNPDISINLVPTVNPFNPIHTVDNLLESTNRSMIKTSSEIGFPKLYVYLPQRFLRD